MTGLTRQRWHTLGFVAFSDSPLSLLLLFEPLPILPLQPALGGDVVVIVRVDLIKKLAKTSNLVGPPVFRRVVGGW